MRSTKFFSVIMNFLVLIFSQPAWSIPAYNMPIGVTPTSHAIYQLHMTVFWICVGIGVIVFSVMLYALIMHRKSRGVTPAKFHEHPGLEITWAIIPFIILVLMAIPATKVLMNMSDDSHADLTIKITGYQWKWRYEYLDYGISFFSNLTTPQDQIHNKQAKNPHYLLEVDNPLVVPTHKKIRLLVTGNDVIHSWWVPSLGVKMDGIPGFIHSVWTKITEPGIYRGQCAELCGVNHGFMPIVVEAKTEEEFAKWVATQSTSKTLRSQGKAVASKQWTKEELMNAGQKVYEATCAVCHKPDGTGMPPAFPPMKDSKIATGPVAKHIDMVLNGVAGTAMQAFGTQLTDDDIAAVITYERNAWGNDDVSKWGKEAGGIVQPIDISKARK